MAQLKLSSWSDKLSVWPYSAFLFKTEDVVLQHSTLIQLYNTPPEQIALKKYLKDFFGIQAWNRKAKDNYRSSMSKPSRLVRPSSASAASKLPLTRREDLGSRSKTISLGEKMLRAGSEGNLVKQQQVHAAVTPSQRKASTPKGQGKTNLRVTSVEDAEHVKPKERLANGSNHTSNTKPARNIPRRHTVGGPRSSKEILGMQTSEMDRKREAFLEHLKQKYPHHATAIMGHQERLRDQTLQCMLDSLQSELDIQRYLVKIESSQRARSPKPSQNLQSGVGDQTEHLSGASAESLEAMSEGEAPVAFTRGSRSRASLPVVRSSNQTKDKSLGILYLQYGDETKQTKMPNEITSADTIRALFVSAFPQQLTMKILDSPSVAIYVKEEMRNVYHELTDVRNIQDRSFLKVYHKDPVHAFNQNARAINGDIRIDCTMDIRTLTLHKRSVHMCQQAMVRTQGARRIVSLFQTTFYHQTLPFKPGSPPA
nr:PREDICTED: sickle tail protein homolog [Latimeria chalumnae]|eukprot:XP_006000322.2 PREDICTED: sickle tail protein homolog [Latimeria chalumnae]